MSSGLVLVNTGPGKGKTTAALGVTLRALGHGRRVLFLQFIKSASTGESAFLDEYAREHPDRLYFAKLGLGFVGDRPKEADLEMAKVAMGEAEARRREADLVVLDELNVAVSLGLVPLGWAKNFIETRPEDQDIVITGRDCPEELCDLAHTVTEMREVKHAYRQGIKAKKGVDYCGPAKPGQGPDLADPAAAGGRRILVLFEI
ncbi:MAG: cob(I)yrinic acid a,c-diamide adenosyltransferase [Deltaproteobacteria bacterium]|jgi:cob(I)alamin adenosyltransferase|nr:cob(I)yrinic acid a,c-diamide adenosyltransferase [Deltaproteobacteria bacterium]